MFITKRFLDEKICRLRIVLFFLQFLYLWGEPLIVYRRRQKRIEAEDLQEFHSENNGVYRLLRTLI